MKREMEIVKEMKERVCRNQIKTIAYKVALAMAAGEKKIVVSPIYDENLKAVILTYEATVTRARESHGLKLDIISWEKDLPRNARNYMSNFFERPACFEEFKQLIGKKKDCEMRMRDVEKNKV